MARAAINGSRSPAAALPTWARIAASSCWSATKIAPDKPNRAVSSASTGIASDAGRFTVISTTPVSFACRSRRQTLGRDRPSCLAIWS